MLRPHGLVLGLSLVGVGGCGLRPPVQNSGPAVSREGVQLAVTGQDCSETIEPDQPGNDLVQAILEVQVRNATPAPLTVRRDAFRLLAPDGRALPATPFSDASPVEVRGGEAQVFQLRFMTRGGLACAREMTLDAADGVVASGRPLAIGAVTITPRRQL
jgi:hypothetical protein